LPVTDSDVKTSNKINKIIIKIYIPQIILMILLTFFLLTFLDFLNKYKFLIITNEIIGNIKKE
jgi:hypothetical protein